MRETLSYADVLIRPSYTTLRSRSDAVLATTLCNGVRMDIPIVSANMPAVTDFAMAAAMGWQGGCGFLHRFMSIQANVMAYEAAAVGGKLVGVSLGVHEGMTRADELYAAGATVFLVDVAHADSRPVHLFVEELRNHLDAARIIVGNVATSEAVQRLESLGVDAIKVGVGPGAACTTRQVTGAGRGQLTAVMECADAAHYTPIIADGGISTSGDIVKAIGAGASSVMLGRMLAGCDESPEPGAYWGNASHRQNGHRAPEGVAGTVPRTGSLEDTIKPLLWGLRSGISYAGHTSVDGLRGGVRFERIASGVAAESSARI